jgi:osmotically-inducible protein OsmY
LEAVPTMKTFSLQRTLFTILTLTLTLAVSESGASAIQKPVSDDSIHDQVLMRLAGDAEVKGGVIDVQVENGVVTLKGKVETAKQKTKAEHIARKVKGVKSVVNQLVVGPR